jgi:hypothetical protein
VPPHEVAEAILLEALGVVGQEERGTGISTYRDWRFEYVPPP